jgi:hypothetical protein
MSKIRGVIVAGAAVLALSIKSEASATTYLFKTIDVPGATGLGTVAFGINDLNVVSGTYWVTVGLPPIPRNSAWVPL